MSGAEGRRARRELAAAVAVHVRDARGTVSSARGHLGRLTDSTATSGRGRLAALDDRLAVVYAELDAIAGELARIAR